MKCMATFFKISSLVLGLGVCHLMTSPMLHADVELSDNFPVGPEVRRRADFWKKVYTEINSWQAYVHDAHSVDTIYKTVSFEGMSRRRKRRFLNKEKRIIRKQLRDLSRKLRKGKDLEGDDLAFWERIGKPDHKRLSLMAREVRYQQGMKDRYYKGLIRSQKYIDQIREIFKKMGLPLELAYMPHVESSFNYMAYSKVGAAGMWQFMRSSARVYRMKMNYVIDERRDPIISTRAAARHLIDNYKKLQTWPLAVTAYNHGPASIARAVSRVGSRSMDDIILKYKARRFGFASKNFYATFVAATEISMNTEKYFPELPKTEPFRYAELVLNKRVTVGQLRKSTGFSKQVLQEYNPALRPIAFRSNLYLPRRFKLKLPPSAQDDLQGISQKIAQLKAPAPVKGGGGVHIVSRGESLYLISKVYSASMRDIIYLNGIDRPSRIRPGMKLKIPGSGQKIARKTVQVAKNTAPSKQEAKKGRIERKDLAMLSKPPQGEHARPRAKAARPEKSSDKSGDVQLAAADQSGSQEKEEIGFFAKLKNLFTQPTEQEQPPKSGTEVAQASLEEQAHQSEPDVDISSYDLEAAPIRGGYYRVSVEVEETLGHLAEWADIRAQQIRNWNGLSFGRPIHMGQKLRIRMSEEKLASFNRQRAQYHQAIEEDFFGSYRLDGVREYVVKRGDTINDLVNELEIPMWLIRKFQKENPTLQLHVGQKIHIPVVVAKNDTSSQGMRRDKAGEEAEVKKAEKSTIFEARF